MELVYYPDALLGRICEPVTEFDDVLRDISLQLTKKMHLTGCVGISAPQVGISRRIITVLLEGSRSRSALTMVNPRITQASNDVVSMSEGCLSVPDVLVSLDRPETIEVEYQDVDGGRAKTTLCGWSSRIVQHEVDHLEGVMTIDRMPPTMRGVIVGCYETNVNLHVSSPVMRHSM
jgi:peptide deformylase